MAASFIFLVLARILCITAQVGIVVDYTSIYGEGPSGSPPVEAYVAPVTYQCTVCRHMYDPNLDGKPSGEAFEDLPDNWTCPVCGKPKSVYVPSEAYVCTVCNHVYDPNGDGNGTAFADLPNDWMCPVCGRPKTAYTLVPVPGPSSTPGPAPLHATYKCTVCAHMYDPDGDGTPSGEAFEALPDDWLCPVCGQPKSVYIPSEGYVCTVCDHVYDPDLDGNKAAFVDLPTNWVCPVCGQPTSAYVCNPLAPATVCSVPVPPPPPVNAGIVVAAVFIGLLVPVFVCGGVWLVKKHYVDKGRNIMPMALRVH